MQLHTATNNVDAHIAAIIFIFALQLCILTSSVPCDVLRS
jgi:hypothetical protein